MNAVDDVAIGHRRPAAVGETHDVAARSDGELYVHAPVERPVVLATSIVALDERSQLVLQLYFFEEMNLEEIGHVMNVGAARVCQIKKVALAKLREQCGSSSLFWALNL